MEGQPVAPDARTEAEHQAAKPHRGQAWGWRDSGPESGVSLRTIIGTANNDAKEKECRELSLVPDEPFSDLCGAAEDADGQRGIFFGKLVLTERAS